MNECCRLLRKQSLPRDSTLPIQLPKAHPLLPQGTVPDLPLASATHRHMTRPRVGGPTPGTTRPGAMPCMRAVLIVLAERPRRCPARRRAERARPQRGRRMPRVRSFSSRYSRGKVKFVSLSLSQTEARSRCQSGLPPPKGRDVRVAASGAAGRKSTDSFDLLLMSSRPPKPASSKNTSKAAPALVEHRARDARSWRPNAQRAASVNGRPLLRKVNGLNSGCLCGGVGNQHAPGRSRH